MSYTYRQVHIAFVLCLAALVAGLGAHLALTDIAHGEADLRLEWGMVRVAAIVILAALLASLRVLHGILRAGRAPRTSTRRIARTT